LQGEGQEFESPRLHHLRPPRSGGSDPAQGCIAQIVEYSGWTPGRPTTKALFHGRLRGKVLRAVFVCPSQIAPLIRDLPTELTDQRIAGSPARQRDGRPPRAGSTLTTGYVCSAVNRSSISPSQFKDTIPIDPVLAPGRLVRCWRGSSYKGHGVDALAPRADEGRGRLRKASGSREQTLIRRCPNGETRLG
jgi:hypothetical protein